VGVCTTKMIGFSSWEHPTFQARYRVGDIFSDGGVRLLRAADRRLNSAMRIAPLLKMVREGLAEPQRGRPVRGQNLEPYWRVGGAIPQRKTGDVGSGGAVHEPEGGAPGVGAF
jgi:hypothetical protein